MTPDLHDQPPPAFLALSAEQGFVEEYDEQDWDENEPGDSDEE